MSNFIRAESKGRFLIYFKYEYSFVTKNGFREFKVPLSDFLKALKNVYFHNFTKKLETCQSRDLSALNIKNI